MTKHKRFIQSNQLKVQDLSEGIKDKIEVFDEMQKVIERLSGSTKDQKNKELKRLDQEIYDDLLEAYGSELDNNDISNEKNPQAELDAILDDMAKENEKLKKAPKPLFKKGDTVEITGGNPKFIGETAQVIEYLPSGANSKAPDSVTLESKKFPEGKALYEVGHILKSTGKPKANEPTGDEKILNELFTMGRTKNLKRKMLRGLGLQTTLGRKPVRIGNMVLVKVDPFSFTYNLKRELKTKSA